MELTLTRKLDRPTIIVGFPGIGLVGPIVTEFLIEHMKTEQVGEFRYDDLPPTVAIHKGKLIHPMSLHYSEEHNTLIVYTLLNVQGKEWGLAKEILALKEQTHAKEIVCIDGANTVGEDAGAIYFFGNDDFAQHGAQEMKESVITGVAGALLLRSADVSCIFAAVDMQLPNAKAAANVVGFLDKYLGLGVDSEPLLKQAEQFERKLKGVLEQGKRLRDEKERGAMSYLG